MNSNFIEALSRNFPDLGPEDFERAKTPEGQKILYDAIIGMRGTNVGAQGELFS